MGLGQHSLGADEDTGQYTAVSHSVPHPLYNTSLLEPRFLSPNADNSHDLMLLQLSKPAIITEAVSVLSLPTEEPELGSHCLASGWGIIKPDKCMPGPDPGAWMKRLGCWASVYPPWLCSLCLQL